VLDTADIVRDACFRQLSRIHLVRRLAWKNRKTAISNFLKTALVKLPRHKSYLHRLAVALDEHDKRQVWLGELFDYGRQL
jgi:hypothetical protein